MDSDSGVGVVLVIVGWLIAVVIQFLLAPLLISAVVAGGAGYALWWYLLESWRVLRVNRPAGPSPVRDPPSSPSGQPAAGAPPSGEPAYRAYLVQQAWRDAWTVLRRAAARLWKDGSTAHLKLSRLMMESDGMVAVFAWPSWIAIGLGTALLAIPLGAAALALALSQLAAVALWALAWLLVVGTLGLVEHLLLLVRRIVVACPHPGCYQRFGLPVYACPADSCPQRHARLVPNLYGALRHVCRCGARLPTLILLGRHRLAGYCPHCRRRLPGRSGRVRVEHVPIVGGPDAGKSTFLCLAVGALRTRLDTTGGSLSFVDTRDEAAVSAALGRIRHGARVDKTTVELPRAVMLDVRPSGEDGRILYLFDPAGEYYGATDMVDSQRYLDHAEVALVVVDPLAVAGVRRGLTDADRGVITAAAPQNQPDVVRESPGDVVDRLVVMLRSRPSGGKLRRVLVVVSKTDVLRRTSVGTALAGPEPDTGAWLAQVGWGNWTRALEECAGQVRYLASGLDLDDEAFAEPVAWLSGLRPDTSSGARVRHRPAPQPWISASRPGTIPYAYRGGRLTLLLLGGVAAVVSVVGAVSSLVLALLAPYL